MLVLSSVDIGKIVYIVEYRSAYRCLSLNIVYIVCIVRKNVAPNLHQKRGCIISPVIYFLLVLCYHYPYTLQFGGYI